MWKFKPKIKMLVQSRKYWIIGKIYLRLPTEPQLLFINTKIIDQQKHPVIQIQHNENQLFNIKIYLSNVYFSFSEKTLILLGQGNTFTRKTITEEINTGNPWCIISLNMFDYISWTTYWLNCTEQKALKISGCFAVKKSLLSDPPTGGEFRRFWWSGQKFSLLNTLPVLNFLFIAKATLYVPVVHIKVSEGITVCTLGTFLSSFRYRMVPLVPTAQPLRLSGKAIWFSVS